MVGGIPGKRLGVRREEGGRAGTVATEDAVSMTGWLVVMATMEVKDT